jgi:hypothetical protein
MEVVVGVQVYRTRWRGGRVDVRRRGGGESVLEGAVLSLGCLCGISTKIRALTQSRSRPAALEARMGLASAWAHPLHTE